MPDLIKNSGAVVDLIVIILFVKLVVIDTVLPVLKWMRSGTEKQESTVEEKLQIFARETGTQIRLAIQDHQLAPLPHNDKYVTYQKLHDALVECRAQEHREAEVAQRGRAAIREAHEHGG